MWHGTKELSTRYAQKYSSCSDRNGQEAYMWIPKLVPKRADRSNLYDVSGTVTFKNAASVYTPSRELETFLGNGGPIVVGSGSVGASKSTHTTRMILEAAPSANVRVLIQSNCK
ncbi:hypothetical protein PsorP6_014757 [Peronosclerospora sorghi]|uniref:Uncharacterized protein n=1 Tax=Peronosclerospora sorghi TaxID=230839 RepID=A0ACC0VS33_9STRA|nr:hypothetical protein PsorP6_014757 [Peronosclerospora sorghi]